MGMPGAPMPALLKSTSRRPKMSLVFANSAQISSGLLTSVGALVVGVNATANLGFTAYMLLYVGVPGSFYFADATRTAGADIASIIPPYLALLIPVLLLDLLARREGRSALVASLVAGPLSVFIDGRFSLFSGLCSLDVTTLVYLLPMILGGLAA